MATPIPLLGVLGSTTSPGRLRRAVDGGLDRHGERAELLDLAEVTLPFADGRPPSAAGGDTAAVIGRIESAAALLLATPVYRGSLTGALKNLLDLVPVEALEAKPVALLAMGATPHHLLGPERHLRDVLSFFGARVTPVAGYLTSKDFRDGRPLPAAEETVDSLLGDLIEARDRGGPAPGRLRPLAAGI
jgi:FMN reductase